MQIKIRYDYQIQTVEVPDEECESMIRNDYEERRAAAADPSTVQPRTMQEIMDDRFNKPEYNSIHQYRANNRTLDAYDDDDRMFEDDADPIGTALEQDELVAALHKAIATLSPQQQDLVRRIYFEGEMAMNIAAEDGVSKTAIHNRMNRIYADLKKILKNLDFGG